MGLSRRPLQSSIDAFRPKSLQQQPFQETDLMPYLLRPHLDQRELRPDGRVSALILQGGLQLPAPLLIRLSLSRASGPIRRSANSMATLSRTGS
jgi:hypothetical protein